MKVALLISVIVLASWGKDANGLTQKEFRTLVPYSLEEFHLGYLWSIAESSVLETGGGEGVQIITSKPFESDEIGAGQYTHRVLHLDSKGPPLFHALAGGRVKVHEESWTTSSFVVTEYKENKVMGDDFHMTIKTKYVDDDDCQRNDVHAESGNVEVVEIDFTQDVTTEERDLDPTQCTSEILDRGPLTSGWQTKKPHMCIYSYVEVEFTWDALTNVAEPRTIDAYQSILEKFHRQMFCWADQWADMSMDDVRMKERQTKAELNRIRKKGDVRGHMEGLMRE